MSKIAWNDEEGGIWNESEMIEWQWNDGMISKWLECYKNEQEWWDEIWMTVYCWNEHGMMEWHINDDIVTKCAGNDGMA